MHRILPARQHWPLHRVASARRIEASALAASLPATPDGSALMQRAGAALTHLAGAIAPHAQRVWVAAGPGNNGGDGLEAAWGLHRRGLSVSVSLVGDPQHLPPHARVAWQRAVAAGVPVHLAGSGGSGPPLGPGDLAIDALLGLGTSRAPDGVIAALVDRLNALPCLRLAVDLPSGLDADTGRVLGAAAVQAHHCLSLLTLRPGLFTATGRDHAGTVWLDTLGVDITAEPADAWLAGPSGAGRWDQPGRHASHKGSHGDVLVVGGAPGMAGAAVLAGRAALAAGAGRVWVVPLDPAAARGDPLHPELMWLDGRAAIDPDRFGRSTTVCGCGGGQAVGGVLPAVLLHAARLVLDADALNALALDPALGSALSARGQRGQPSILTPHPLEAARLLGCTLAEVQADRLQAAQTLAERWACVVVLKGSGSVVAAPGQVPRINASGNAALATAGTGDVLAGWLGGSWGSLAAQAPADLPPALAVALAGVWRHGAAAEASGLPLLRASGLVEQMARPLTR